ncbi:histone-lysine N-methyltransferase SMYD3 isoform X2 [Solenopsis invicta]|nr:histone-lysine N-methyltransferase SMYD3 isoform X2 [Solenopsis invicta]
MARIIIQLNKVGDDVPGILLSSYEYFTAKNFRTFKDLMSHYSDIIVDKKRMEHFNKIHKILFQLLDETLMPNTSELISIYGKLCTNRFGIVNESLNDLGIGLYLGASIMDHSCKPNAIASFKGTTVIVRTLTDLPSVDWSQIRITYVNLLNSNKDRREELYNSYYFWCDCERCKEKEPMAACPNSSCDWPCSIEDDKCEKCSARISAEFKKNFQEVMDFIEDCLEKMKTTTYVNDKLSLSKKCLEKQKNVMHKFNIQHVRTLERAFITATNQLYWQDVEFYGKKLVPGYKLYFGEVHSDTGMLYMYIGMAQRHLGKSNEALETLNKAKTVLKISYGEKNSFVSTQMATMDVMESCAIN